MPARTPPAGPWADVVAVSGPVHRVVAGALVRGDRVLLGHRSPARRWFPDVWDFPGGHVEDGERPEEALRRELIEEIGVDVGDVAGEPVLHLRDESTGFDLTVWQITSWQGTVANLQADEHDEVGWFTETELSQLSFADRSYLSLLEQVLHE